MPGLTPDAIFDNAFKKGASDVHVSEGSPILYRIDGELVPASKGAINAAGATQIVKAVLGAANFKRFEAEKEIDVSYSVKGGVRLRVNCHYERGYPSLVARLIPKDIPSMEDLGLIGQVDQFCDLIEGLILFTGPTGAGKSTSMASMIDEVRKRRDVHIVTLEDPVEYVYEREGGGLIRQRQFGEDFLNFPDAMRGVLRQDPDVVLVGEMRDQETIAAALTLAETGHLVFGTLHTPNAMQTIDRIIDVFPSHQQPQVRAQMSLSLKVIVAQRLLRKEGGGRVAVREVLVNNKAVANTIREARTHELISVMQMGAKDGMISFETDAKRLDKEGLIDQDAFDEIMMMIDITKQD